MITILVNYKYNYNNLHIYKLVLINLVFNNGLYQYRVFIDCKYKDHVQDNHINKKICHKDLLYQDRLH